MRAAAHVPNICREAAYLVITDFPLQLLLSFEFGNGWVNLWERLLLDDGIIILAPNYYSSTYACRTFVFIRCVCTNERTNVTTHTLVVFIHAWIFSCFFLIHSRLCATSIALPLMVYSSSTRARATIVVLSTYPPCCASDPSLVLFRAMCHASCTGPTADTHSLYLTLLISLIILVLGDEKFKIR
jgi:hypothetical protein